jgi:rhamnosyltransferase
MKVLAIVILYHPDLQILHENLMAFTYHVDTTMIWDNSPKETFIKNENYVRNLFPHIIIQGNGINHGISYGLNQAWEYARQNQFDVLLTMDQDSIFCDFDTYLKRVEKKWNAEGLSACGPTPNLQKSDDISTEFRKESHLITSGMLVPVSLLNVCGGYCQDYMIDGIDIELCYRLKNCGYQTFIDNRSNLVQRFGQHETRKIPFWGEKAFSNYNASRLYEIFRNHIITWRRYRFPWKLAKLIFYEYFISYVIKDIIILGNNKKKHLYAVYKGIIDGFRFHIQK